MGKFIIKQAKTGPMFDLKSGNGEIVATSEIYKSMASCKKGIASVQKNCVAPIEDTTEKGYKEIKNPKFQMYLDKKKAYRFRLTALNGQVIAASQAYADKAACEKGIASVKKNAPTSPIVEEKA